MKTFIKTIAAIAIAFAAFVGYAIYHKVDTAAKLAAAEEQRATEYAEMIDRCAKRGPQVIQIPPQPESGSRVTKVYANPGFGDWCPGDKDIDYARAWAWYPECAKNGCANPKLDGHPPIPGIDWEATDEHAPLPAYMEDEDEAVAELRELHQNVKEVSRQLERLYISQPLRTPTFTTYR